jgi:hypothetical protein
MVLCNALEHNAVIPTFPITKKGGHWLQRRDLLSRLNRTKRPSDIAILSFKPI